MTGFNPFRSTPRPCWSCRWFHGMDQYAALCLHPGCSAVRSSPENGCSAFEREPGIDDEVAAPVDAPQITPEQRVRFLKMRGQV